MATIEELRKRFKAAEARLESADEEREDFAARLTGLMARIETVLHDYKTENQAQEGENARLMQENQELHEMLNRLLSAVETRHLSGTLEDLGRKLRAFELLPENEVTADSDQTSSDDGSLERAIEFCEVLDPDPADDPSNHDSDAGITEASLQNLSDQLFPPSDDEAERSAEAVVRRVTELVRGLSNADSSGHSPTKH